MPGKTIFLVPYPLGEAPSQRFRFEQYLHLLKQRGVELRVQSFLTVKTWRKFYHQGNVALKLTALVLGFLKRFIILFTLHKYEFIFIHREAAPIGPPIFEWIIAKILRKKIIYDFDDAIWLSDGKNESVLFKLLKWRSKVSSICSWSYKVSCGNHFLSAYALNYSMRVVYNPTTIDTLNRHTPQVRSDISSKNLIIGWTGSHSTMKYLTDLEPVLQRIQKNFNVGFLVISDKKPDLQLSSITFMPWREASEIEDLAMIDIGVMPLTDDKWSEGKCGFKLLQYMALSIPAVASPVGVNRSIIDNGKEGYLCSSAQEWEAALTTLINDASLRLKMGQNGRKKVIDQYSVSSNSSNFASIFE